MVMKETDRELTFHLQQELLLLSPGKTELFGYLQGQGTKTLWFLLKTGI
jgi:hypothetical protein